MGSLRTRTLSHEAVRALGIELNGDRVPGWVERAAALLDTPATTLRGWATPPTSRASRPITGAAANLLVLYVLAQRKGVSPDGLLRDMAAEIARMEAETNGGAVPRDPTPLGNVTE